MEAKMNINRKYESLVDSFPSHIKYMYTMMTTKSYRVGTIIAEIVFRNN